MQVEYYFSKENWDADDWLREQAEGDPSGQGLIALKQIGGFKGGGLRVRGPAEAALDIGHGKTNGCLAKKIARAAIECEGAFQAVLGFGRASLLPVDLRPAIKRVRFAIAVPDLAEEEMRMVECGGRFLRLGQDHGSFRRAERRATRRGSLLLASW